MGPAQKPFCTVKKPANECPLHEGWVTNLTGNTVARRSVRRSGIVLAVAFALSLAGCAKKPSEEDKLASLPPQTIYAQAEQNLSNRKTLTKAADLFGEVERLYPYSEWAKRALIMQAFAYHQAKDYENSRASAQRYIDFYPADVDAAYAQYLIALSYYDQIEEVGRDQALTFQALQALRTVIEVYPDSDYARAARMKFDLAFDHLAGKEMEVGRYYLSHKNYLAAINRFRSVVEDFQTTNQTPEALFRLVEAYLTLGLNDEAQSAGAILGYNYRGTSWYSDAYKLLTDKGLQPKVRGNNWLAAAYRQMILGKWL